MDSKKYLLRGLVLVILLAGLGGGYYLTQNKTDFLPKAGVSTEVPSISMILTTPKSNVSPGEVFPVDILVHTDIDAANLFVSRLEYKDSLKVVKIATISADSAGTNDYFIQKWIKLDNKLLQRRIDIIGGVVSPGLQTRPQDKKILARVFFQALKSGTTNITQEGSAIYRNIDNLNVLKTAPVLTVNVDNNGSVGSVPEMEDIPQENFNPLLSPRGGEVFDYAQPLKVDWGKELQGVAVSVLINGVRLGDVATNLPKSSSFSFSPTSKIPLAFMSKSNTFQIRVIGQDETGQTTVFLNEQPFEFSMTPIDLSTSSSSGAVELLKEFQSNPNIDLATLSLLLTSYNSDKNLTKVDFNQDGFVNEIDLWILKSLLQI